MYDIRVFGVPKKEQSFGQIGHGKRYETLQTLHGGYERLQMSHPKKDNA